MRGIIGLNNGVSDVVFVGNLRGFFDNGDGIRRSVFGLPSLDCKIHVTESQLKEFKEATTERRQFCLRQEDGSVVQFAALIRINSLTVCDNMVADVTFIEFEELDSAQDQQAIKQIEEME